MGWEICEKAELCITLTREKPWMGRGWVVITKINAHTPGYGRDLERSSRVRTELCRSVGTRCTIMMIHVIRRRRRRRQWRGDIEPGERLR